MNIAAPCLGSLRVAGIPSGDGVCYGRRSRTRDARWPGIERLIERCFDCNGE